METKIGSRTHPPERTTTSCKATTTEMRIYVHTQIDFDETGGKPGVVLATGPGNPPAVRVLTCGSVRLGSRTGQKPEPLWSWRVVAWPALRTAGIWPGWHRTAVPNIRFLQLGLHLSI